MTTTPQRPATSSPAITSLVAPGQRADAAPGDVPRQQGGTRSMGLVAENCAGPGELGTPEPFDSGLQVRP